MEYCKLVLCKMLKPSRMFFVLACIIGAGFYFYEYHILSAGSTQIVRNTINLNINESYSEHGANNARFLSMLNVNTRKSATPHTKKTDLMSTTTKRPTTVPFSTTAKTRTKNPTTVPTTHSTTRTPLTTTTTAQTTLAPPPYSCPFPNPHPWDRSIKKYLRIYPTLNCKGNKKPSLVYRDGDNLIINKAKVTDIVKAVDFCHYAPLRLSVNDLTLQDLKWSDKFTDSIKLADDMEHVFVECLVKDKVVGESYISRIFEKPEVEKRSKELYQKHLKEDSPAETLSVMFVGIDGMSKQNLIRTMPKTRKFMLETLKARELNKFNKIADNTFQNVVVLLSGYNHRNIKKVNSFDMSKEYFDKVGDIFLWHDYKQAGYRVAAIFDIIKGTAFHYLKQGWKKSPWDYYHRPVPLMADKKSATGGDCIGDQPEIGLLLDYYKQLTSHFNNTKSKPYFAYSFFTHLSHDNQNEASKGDVELLDFFQTLYQRNVLNNTLLIFFSDHGPRFGNMRSTYVGKIEAVSPYIFFRFPPWFEKKYPEQMATFNMNQNRLTSFYDVHATLQDLLNFKGKKFPTKTPGTSLFQEIPLSRTCDDAGIQPEYCACTKLSATSVDKDLSQTLSKIVLDMIMKRTSEKRSVCASLSIKSIHSIRQLESADSKTQYHVTIETSPGNGVFEALLNYQSSSKKAVLIGDIIRLNLYRGQDACVNTLSLKPYCYCKS